MAPPHGPRDRTRRFGALRRTPFDRRLFTFRGVAPDNFRWTVERGGGALYDLGAYALTAPLWLTGWPTVSSVSAVVRWASPGVDAETTASLELATEPAPVLAEARMSIDADEEQQLVVRTDRGAVALSAPVFTSRNETSSITARLDDGSDELVEQFDPVDSYVLMLDHVSRAIRGDATAWVLPLSESVRSAELLDAVREASPR